jgi:hypothetical protein
MQDEIDEEYEVGPSDNPPAPAATAAPPVPDDLATDIDFLDLDATLAFTQKKRVRVINQINKNLHQIEDPAMISAMLKGLGDMDKAVISRRRVGIEEEASKTADQQARNSAEILRSINAKLFQVPAEAGSAPRETPKLPDDIIPVMVPGETDIQTHQLSYDAFAKGIQQEPA